MLLPGSRYPKGQSRTSETTGVQGSRGENIKNKKENDGERTE